MYDIKNYAYIEGHLLPEESEHRRHLMIDIGEEGNVDRVTRVLDLAVAKCRELMYVWTKHAMKKPSLDNIFKEREEYQIVLNVPSDFSQTTLTLLERLIHEYLVCMVISDWTSMIYPDKASIWKEKADDAERELCTAFHSKIGHTRIRLHPF